MDAGAAVGRVLDWLAGRLSGGERVWTAIFPALLLLAYFAVAGALYLLRNRTHGRFADEEIDARGDGGFTARPLRHFFAWTMRPWWKALASVRFPPNAVTLLSLLIALGAGVAVAAGRFALGGWLFVFAGALDFLDGRLARSTGQTSLGGAALDSVLDRYVEGALLAGLCWYYRESWVLAACLLALTGSFLVPYVRARAEGLGVQIKSSGFMQRPERVALLGAGTALSPVLEVFLAPADPHPPHRLAIVAIVLIGIGSHASAIQRLVALLRSTGAGGAGSRSLAARPLKSALTNAVATAADFLIASALFYLWYVHPPVATGAGCAVGAIVSFVLSRAWAFQATDAPAFPQLVRYGAVSLSTMVLNAGGVALLLLLDLPFVVAWCVARLAIFATWSYPVQRDFVFAGGPRHAPAPIADPEPSGASRF